MKISIRRALTGMAASFAGVAVVFGATVAGPAAATVTTPVTCTGAEWFVNADETDRKPERTAAGFVFEGTDLTHHATSLALADLKPGSFTAIGTPDQPSFFSVEVRDVTTNAYGTLRWNTGTSKWDLVTNVDSFSKSDPADYVGTETKWGKLTSAAKVVTFGVGYTKNPAGTVKTTVKSVTFAGKVYDLTCTPPTTAPTSSPTASPSPSVSVSPSASATASPSVTPTSVRPTATRPTIVPVPAGNAGPSLPVTGVSLPVIIGGGLAMLVLGAGAYFIARRRKVEFTS